MRKFGETLLCGLVAASLVLSGQEFARAEGDGSASGTEASEAAAISALSEQLQQDDTDPRQPPQYCKVDSAGAPCPECEKKSQNFLMSGISQIADAIRKDKPADPKAELFREQIKAIALQQNLVTKMQLLKIFEERGKSVDSRGPFYTHSVTTRGDRNPQKSIDACLGTKSLRRFADNLDRNLKNHWNTDEKDYKKTKRDQFLKEYMVASAKAERVFAQLARVDREYAEKMKALRKEQTQILDACQRSKLSSRCKQIHELAGKKKAVDDWKKAQEGPLAGPLNELRSGFPMLFDVNSPVAKPSKLHAKIAAKMKTKYPALRREAMKQDGAYPDRKPTDPLDMQADLFEKTCGKTDREQNLARPTEGKKYWADAGAVAEDDLSWLYTEMSKQDAVVDILQVLDKSTRAICESDGKNIYQNAERAALATDLLTKNNRMTREEAQKAHCALYEHYPVSRFDKALTLGGGAFLAGTAVAVASSGGLSVLGGIAFNAVAVPLGLTFTAMEASDHARHGRYVAGVAGTALGSCFKESQKHFEQAAKDQRSNSWMLALSAVGSAVDIGAAAKIARDVQLARSGHKAIASARQGLASTEDAGGDAARAAAAQANAKVFQDIANLRKLPQLGEKDVIALISLAESAPDEEVKLLALQVLDSKKASPGKAAERLKEFQDQRSDRDIAKLYRADAEKWLKLDAQKELRAHMSALQMDDETKRMATVAAFVLSSDPKTQFVIGGRSVNGRGLPKDDVLRKLKGALNCSLD